MANILPVKWAPSEPQGSLHPEPDRQADSFGDDGAAVDVLVVTDARLRIVEVAPSSLAPPLVGSSVHELVAAESRAALHRAIECCVSHSRIERLQAVLASDGQSSYLLRVAPRETPLGVGVVVSGLVVGSLDETPDAGRLPVIDGMMELVDRLPMAVFFKDIECRLVYGNRKFLDSVGADSLDAVVGKSSFELYDQVEAEVSLDFDRQVIESGVALDDVEEQQTRPDGTVESLLTSKFPVLDSNGAPSGLMGYFKEVSEPIRVAEALRSSEQRYAMAVRASRDGIWDFDLLANSYHLSPRASELLNLSECGADVPWAAVSKVMGREQSDKVIEAFEHLRSDPRSVAAYSISIPLSDGSIRWLEIQGIGLMDNGVMKRIVGSIADVSEERRRRDELHHQATHDDLTGLPNRRAVTARLAELAENQTTCSLLYLDLDGFKVVNDSMGHRVGDQMLVAITGRLQRAVADDDLIARLGGDEFAIVLVGADHRRRAVELAAERIPSALARPIAIGKAEIYATISTGVVHAERRHRSAQDLLRDADIALYRAKERGKAGYCLFEESMGSAAIDELALQTELRRATERREFMLHYQPVHDAVTQQAVAVEALLRWPDADGNSQPTALFLPHLERSGLIVEVGRWIINESCRQLAEWRQRDERATDLHMAINLSRVQFNAGDLIRSIEDALERHDLVPNDLTVEVTETAVSADSRSLVTQLTALQALGVRVALDDFGVGQSSLSQLHDLPIDLLKIDKTFVDRINAEGGTPVLEASFHIARALGLTTVAEGVETAEQMRWLTGNGCSMLQGYLLSKPRPPEEILGLLGTGGDR